MEPLIIKATKVTPEIILDPYNDNFEISGISRPENVREFYDPVINWLIEFEKEVLDRNAIKFDKNHPLNFNLKMNYFNSSSAKFLYDVMGKLVRFHKKGHLIRILWYFEEEDDDMRYAGEEMSELLEVPFQFIETPLTD
ncbi:MAG: DUF1987 domain-containing protein [Bacteroidales bacterium]|nr:DUF1987 domain-containing protein [Bacteroidales bacterium]